MNIIVPPHPSSNMNVPEFYCRKWLVFESSYKSLTAASDGWAHGIVSSRRLAAKGTSWYIHSSYFAGPSRKVIPSKFCENVESGRLTQLEPVQIIGPYRWLEVEIPPFYSGNIF